MLSSYNSVYYFLKERYKLLICFHCLPHKLELAIHDSRINEKRITVIGEIFIKVYNDFNRSSYRINKLKEIASELGCEYNKPNRIFTIRWISSSVSTIKGFIKGYKALVKYYEERIKEAQSQAQKENVLFILKNIRVLVLFIT